MDQLDCFFIGRWGRGDERFLRNMLTCIMIFFHSHPSLLTGPSQQGGKQNFNPCCTYNKGNACTTTMMQCENGDFSLILKPEAILVPGVHFIESGDIFVTVTTWRGGATGLQRGETRHAAEPPGVHRTGPHDSASADSTPQTCRLRSPILQG